MKCQKCGAEIQPTDKFCSACGTAVRIKILCPNCGRIIDNNVVMCPFCNSSTSPPKKEEIKISYANVEGLKNDFIKCPKCGEEYRSTNLYCPNCGEKTAIPQADAESKPPEKEESENSLKYKLCPKCGERNNATSDFCKSCGNDISTAAVDTETPDNKNQKLIIAACAVIAIIILLAVLLVQLSNNNKPPKNGDNQTTTEKTILYSSYWLNSFNFYVDKNWKCESKENPFIFTSWNNNKMIVACYEQEKSIEKSDIKNYLKSEKAFNDYSFEKIENLNYTGWSEPAYKDNSVGIELYIDYFKDNTVYFMLFYQNPDKTDNDFSQAKEHILNYSCYKTSESTTNKPTEKPTEKVTEKKTEPPTDPPTEKATEKPVEKSNNKSVESKADREQKQDQEQEQENDSISLEYRNAMKKAESYLKYSAFSKDGLYEQLLFEQFPEDAAQYAVDNVSTDWDENALKKAEQYLKTSAFSYSGLYDQLIFEKFTENQAQYALDNINTNWNENALKKGESYLKISSFSKDELYDQLIFEGFSSDQAQYAVDNLFN